jgi:hypothetical protein
LTVVQIVVKDPTSGPKIFDSLNSKQEPMTTGDLVRNEIFSKIARIDPQRAEELDRELWQPFYASFKREKLDTFEGFFFPFGLIQNSQFKKSDVYPELRRVWSELSPEEVMSQLGGYKSEYQDLVFGDNTCGFEKRLANGVARLNQMSFARAALPFLMQVLHEARVGEITQDQAAELLEAVEAFLVRRALCSIEPTGLHAVFKKLWKDLAGVYTTESLRRAISAAKTVTVPSDDDVLRSFEKPLYGKAICKHFLYEYNLSVGGDTSKMDFESIWIEHVLPQSYHAKNWSTFTEEEHSACKDLAGNLLLLTDVMNKDVGQDPFAKKAKIYEEDSMFKSTRVFAKTYKTWQQEQLLARTQELSRWAVIRWPFSD